MINRKWHMRYILFMQTLYSRMYDIEQWFRLRHRAFKYREIREETNRKYLMKRRP